MERIEECTGDVDAKVSANQEMQLSREGDGEWKGSVVGDGGVYGGEDGVCECSAGCAQGGHVDEMGRMDGEMVFKWGGARSTEGRRR